MVEIFYEDIEGLDLDADYYESWLVKVCDSYQKSLDVLCIICCSDSYLLSMNQEHLKHDYYTDIITFNYNEEGSIAGDLFISIDRVKENASDRNLDWMTEFNRVVAHGLLHLIGFNDKTDSDIKEMREAEDLALKIVSRET